MNKKERTRKHILDAGFKHGAQYGLADITIGTLANACNMSRTGVISHFDNKEDMQLAILGHCEQMFKEQVIEPSRRADPVERIHALMMHWLDWAIHVSGEQSVGCPILKAVLEYQNRPDCPVRTYLISLHQQVLDYLRLQVEKAIAQERLPTTVDAHILSFELFSLYMGHTVLESCLGRKAATHLYQQGVERLLAIN